MRLTCRTCGECRAWNHKRDGKLADQVCPHCGTGPLDRAKGNPATPAPVEPMEPGPHTAARWFFTQAQACEATKCPRGNLAHCVGAVCRDFRAADVTVDGIRRGAVLVCNANPDYAIDIGAVASRPHNARAIAAVMHALTLASMEGGRP